MNPFMPSGLFYFSPWTNSFFPVLDTNSEDPDQPPHSEASDRDLHCFQCPFIGC